MIAFVLLIASLPAISADGWSVDGASGQKSSEDGQPKDGRPEDVTSEDSESEDSGCRERGAFCYIMLFGAEGTTIDELSEMGTVRFDALISQKLRDHWYIDGHLRLTSTGELSIQSNAATDEPSMNSDVKPSSDMTNGPPMASDVEQSVEGDLSTYWLLWSGSEYRAGATMLTGVLQKKGSTDAGFMKRYYAGVRISNEQDLRAHYLEILYGKTEGVQGNRLEIKAQMPIPHRDAPIGYVGTQINFGVRNSGEKSPSSLKFFIVVPAGRLFSAFTDPINKMIDSM